MREKKSFFVENNSLNKGYRKEHGSSDRHHAKSLSALPDLGVLEQYEELQPGIVQKLLEMAQKEQSHKHSMEEIAAKMQQVSIRMGRFFGIVTVLAICYVTVSLAMNNMIFEAMIFAAMGFSAIAISACVGKCKSGRCTRNDNTARASATKHYHNNHVPAAQNNSEEDKAVSSVANKEKVPHSNNYRRRRRNPR